LRDRFARQPKWKCLVDAHTYYRAFLEDSPGRALIDHRGPFVGDEHRQTQLMDAMSAGRRVFVVTAPPGCGLLPSPFPRSTAQKDKRSPTMRPMRQFNFNTSAELFPAAIRKKKRAGFAYRRFGTAAEAVRFAIEELPADSLNGAYLQVEEARFDQSGIRTLYESEAFPLTRRPRPVAAETSADAA